MFPINSVYVWKGEVRDENEAALFIKCRREDYEEIEREILRNHSYELPEIALLPIEGGLPGYLDWLEEAARERQVINES
jgi:periplasmic divalent cation tolerance protein